MTRIYSGWVNYGKCSATGFSGATLEEAKTRLIETIAFYTRLGETVTNITLEDVCKACDGTGEKFIPVKRSRTGKHIKCPECKGKNSSIKIL